MLLIILYQLVAVSGELEEISLLRCFADGSAAVGAFAVNGLGLGPEGLAGLAIKPLVVALIDIALVVHFFEYLLHGFLVILIGGPDEFVIGYVHQLPEILDARNDIIDIFLGGNARRLGFILDLLTVLIRAGQEKGVVALEAPVTSLGIRRNGRVGVADMQLIRGIIYRRSDVKSLFIHICLQILLTHKFA